MGAALTGEWTQPFKYASIAVHLHLMPNGQVLSWSRAPERYVWDLKTGTAGAATQIAIESGSRPAAQVRPIDQGPVTSTRCPRARSPATAGPRRSSTTSRPGSACRGQNELGKWWEVTVGTSTAACRPSPRRAWARKNCNVHWSWASPPGVPKARHGSPSRSASEGLRVVRGRMPPAIELASPSSSHSIWARLPRQKPRPGTTGELCSQPPLGVAATRLPCRSTTSTWQVSPKVGSPDPARASAVRMLGKPRLVVTGGAAGIGKAIALALATIALRATPLMIATLEQHPDRDKALDGARVYGGLLIPEAYSYIQDPRVIEQRALLVRDEALSAAFCIATSGEEIIARFEAFIEAGCDHIIWADMSPDPSIVAKVCRDEVLPYLTRKHGVEPMIADVAVR